MNSCVWCYVEQTAVIFKKKISISPTDTSEHIHQGLFLLNCGRDIRDAVILLSFYSNFSDCFNHL